MISGTGPTLRKQTHWCPDSLQANVGHHFQPIRRLAGTKKNAQGVQTDNLTNIFWPSIRTVWKKNIRHISYENHFWSLGHVCVWVGDEVKNNLREKKNAWSTEHINIETDTLCKFLGIIQIQISSINLIAWCPVCPVIQNEFQTRLGNFQFSSIFLHSIREVVASNQNTSIEVATIGFIYLDACIQSWST